jgi:hypothetical protein
MIEWCGRTTLHKHKFNDWKDHSVTEEDKKGLRKVSFLDVQWSTCPVEVENQVRELWSDYTLGNDHSIIETSISELKEMAGDFSDEEELEEIKEDYKITKTDAIVQYLKEQGITNDEEEIIIHWWW